MDRDQIALEAMKVILADMVASKEAIAHEGWTDSLARISYAIADAMLEARADVPK